MPSCTKLGKQEWLSLAARAGREYKCMLIVSNLRPTSAAILGGQREEKREKKEASL